MLKIYTRTGDDGTTTLRGGKRVRKDSPEIEAIGALDELNSAIGLARSLITNRKLDAILADIQNDLFHLDESAPVQKLERLIDELQAELPPLKQFVVPVGPLHFARAVCRRAERACVGRKTVVPYLNRLGDLLFVLARRANRGKETKVSPRRGSCRTAPRAQ
jgi:cob(I)alamin adenosyltransferase